MLNAVALDFNFGEYGQQLAGTGHRLANAAGDDDVVVLEHDAVVQTQPVVQPAAAHHCVLFQHAQAGCGLARVDQAGLGTGDFSVVARGFGGNAAQALGDVERGALCRQNAARRAGHGQQPCAFFHFVAVFDKARDFELRVVLAKHPGRHVNAGHMHGLTRVHVKGAHGVLVNHQLGCQVAVAYVLCQPELNQFLGLEHVIHIDPLNQSMNCATSIANKIFM